MFENFAEKNSNNIEICAVSQDEHSTKCGLNEGGSAKLWHTNHSKLSTRCATIDLTNPWERRRFEPSVYPEPYEGVASGSWSKK